jgi:hypothetical protein
LARYRLGKTARKAGIGIGTGARPHFSLDGRTGRPHGTSVGVMAASEESADGAIA